MASSGNSSHKMNGSGEFGVPTALEQSGQIRFSAECGDYRDSASTFTAFLVHAHPQLGWHRWGKSQWMRMIRYILHNKPSSPIQEKVREWGWDIHSQGLYLEAEGLPRSGDCEHLLTMPLSVQPCRVTWGNTASGVSTFTIRNIFLAILVWKKAS